MAGSNKFIPSIGIETHVQLKTKTKLFAAVGNDARQAKPNTLISHICVAMPGALPYLNRSAVEMAVKAAFALNTRPQKHSIFERKHYFYPDSPMGYQISQLHEPIIIGGEVQIKVGSKLKRIRINRAQLEADAGKNTHPAGADYSLVDLNRTGTPLLEIVSEPDISSATEAKEYARELFLLMKYADISDVDLYHGNMRFDVNVSLSNNPDKLGIRSEVKNLNSFRSVENAVNYEIKRQSEILEKGGSVVQETRGWDEAKQKTTTQRGKEEAHDYRYMPEPDIPPVVLDEQVVGKLAAELPILPAAIRPVLEGLGLDSGVIEDILELDIKNVAQILRIIDKSSTEHARRAAFWLLLPISHGDSSQPAQLDDEQYIKLSQMVSSKKLSSTAAKDVLETLYTKGGDAEDIAKTKNLIQVSDENQIEQIVKEVLDQNQKAVKDLKAGEQKAIGFLIGQVMAKSKGQANPAMVQQTIRKLLNL